MYDPKIFSYRPYETRSQSEVILKHNKKILALKDMMNHGGYLPGFDDLDDEIVVHVTPVDGGHSLIFVYIQIASMDFESQLSTQNSANGFESNNYIPNILATLPNILETYSQLEDQSLFSDGIIDKFQQSLSKDTIDPSRWTAFLLLSSSGSTVVLAGSSGDIDRSTLEYKNTDIGINEVGLVSNFSSISISENDHDSLEMDNYTDVLKWYKNHPGIFPSGGCTTLLARVFTVLDSRNTGIIQMYNVAEIAGCKCYTTAAALIDYKSVISNPAFAPKIQSSKTKITDTSENVLDFVFADEPNESFLFIDDKTCNSVYNDLLDGKDKMTDMFFFNPNLLGKRLKNSMNDMDDDPMSDDDQMSDDDEYIDF